MPQEVLRQSNFTGGELDPAIIGRRDLKAYLASCSSLANCVVMPQGPILRRPGLAYVDRVRSPLLELTHDGWTTNNPAGGDASKILVEDGQALVTTTAMGTTDGYVAAELHFPAPVSLSVVDVRNFAVVAGGGGGGTAPAPSPVQPYPGDPRGGGGGGGGGSGGAQNPPIRGSIP